MLKASIATSFNCPGPSTNGLAWQGAAIWSVEGGGTLHKINPQTGEVILTVNPPTSGSSGLECDGSHFWYSDIGEKMLYKLTVSDLQIVTSFAPPGPSPHGLAWDGESLWSADVQSDRHYKVSPETGEILAEFPFARHTTTWDCLGWDDAVECGHRHAYHLPN